MFVFERSFKILIKLKTNLLMFELEFLEIFFKRFNIEFEIVLIVKLLLLI